LLLLFHPISIFQFCSNEKTKKLCINHFVVFWRRVLLTPMVVIVIPPHIWFVLTYSSSLDGVYLVVRCDFGLKLLFFSFFLSFFSFSFLDCVLDIQKIISVLQFIFSFNSVPLLLFAIVLFTMIISNWILFRFYPYLFDFFNLF